MTDRITIPLPEGVEYEHPEVQRLLNEIEAVKPLPVKLTVREQLAEKLYHAYHSAAGADAPEPFSSLTGQVRKDYLAEADAAIAFFLKVARDAHHETSVDNIREPEDRIHNNAIDHLIQVIGNELNK